MTKVSVIMPAYNRAAYIQQAIASVQAQDLQDWELIVVDDGSTDATASLAQATGDPRVHVLVQSNAGAAAARNAGLQRACGAYVAFLDADDLFLASALSSNARVLDTDTICGVVYADGYFADEAGQPLLKLSRFRPAGLGRRVWDPMVISPFIGANCSAMVRRSAIERRQLRFDPGLVIGEDWKFFLDLAETEDFVANPLPTCLYRLHAQNVSIVRESLRAEHLARIRMATLRSPLLRTASPRTQSTLVYQLLFECFDAAPERQHALVNGAEFDALLPREQSRLLRLLAARWMHDNCPAEWTRGALRRSLDLDAADLRTRLLCVAAAAPGPVARMLLTCRHALARRRAATPQSPFEMVRAMRPA